MVRVSAVVCCVLCGLTRVDLPPEHGCRPNLSPEELAQLKREGQAPKFASLFDLKRASRPQTPTFGLGSASTPGRLAGLRRTVASAQQGQRNTTLHWAACRAGEMVAEGVMGDPWVAAEALAEAAGAAGLDAREIAATIRSGFQSSGVTL